MLRFCRTRFKRCKMSRRFKTLPLHLEQLHFCCIDSPRTSQSNCFSKETHKLLAVLLPHVRRSVETLHIDAAEILVMLQQQVGTMEAPRVSREVDRTLRRMPLSALLGLMIGRCGVRPWLEQEVEALRCRMDPAWCWIIRSFRLRKSEGSQKWTLGQRRPH